MSNPFDAVLNDMRTKLAQRLAGLPHKVGAVVIAHTNEAFRNQGFTDGALEPWTPRKSKKNDAGRAILVLSGRLRRSIRIVRTTPDSVTIGTDVPYAQVHNEGGIIEKKERSTILNYREDKEGKLRLSRVRTITQQRRITTIREGKIYAHGYKMKQRKFLGNSQKQTEDIKTLITDEIKKALSRK